MGLARNAALWAADNRWLREHLTRFRFVRASVRRFMPGESTDEAIAAAKRLAGQGVPTMFTLLGENVTTLNAARQVVEDYRATYDRIVAERLDTEISVKPSHLGVDLDVVVEPAIARPGIVVEQGYLHPLDVADWSGGFRRVR